MGEPLQIRFTDENPQTVRTGLLAIPIFEGLRSQGQALESTDAALGGLLRGVMAEESFTGKLDQQIVVHSHGKIGASRVLLLGAGSADSFALADSQHLAARAARQASRLGLGSIAFALDGLPRATEELARATALTTQGAELGRYRFDRYLTGDGKRLDKLTLLTLLGTSEHAELRQAAVRGQRIAAAVAEVRDLVNEPAYACTPTHLAEHATANAKARKIDCKVLNAEDCKKLGMNLFLAVGMGSDQPPRLIHLTYRPANPKRRLAIIGKGITFDSGGLSLKPAQSMEEMKTDMAGAATVIAAIAAAADLDCRNEVHAIVAACENMPSGKSYRPGDVFTGMGGKSIEVNNTDAEGRLTLADALAYAARLEPNEMVDLATLTGACMVGLGPETAGLMGNDAGVVARVLAAATRAGEAVWQLPLPERLREQLKSEVADMKNTGERYGGALTAGLFLREFTAGKPWAHLDIAGPARADKEWGAIAKGGTGFGVATVVEYLLAE